MSVESLIRTRCVWNHKRWVWTDADGKPRPHAKTIQAAWPVIEESAQW